MQLVAVSEQPVDRPAETVPVDLVAMAQPGLHNPITALDLVDEAVDVGHEVFVDVLDVAGDHRPEQHAAEPRGRIDRQHQRAEGDPPCRGAWPRVPHLQFGEQHRSRLTVRRTA